MLIPPFLRSYNNHRLTLTVVEAVGKLKAGIKHNVIRLPLWAGVISLLFAILTLSGGNTVIGSLPATTPVERSVSGNVEYGSNQSQSVKDSPLIHQAFVDPAKVNPGDTMMVTAEVSDSSGVESVTANMGDVDTIPLELTQGSIYHGTWHGQWRVHDTTIKDYITTIVATNSRGDSSSEEITWRDAQTYERYHTEFTTPAVTSTLVSPNWTYAQTLNFTPNGSSGTTDFLISARGDLAVSNATYYNEAEINVQVPISGTATGGSTTTLVDIYTLTHADDYWNGYVVHIVITTDGLAPQGERQAVTDFVQSTRTLTTNAFTVAIGAGDIYTLSPPATSGSTTTLADTVNLTQADDYWNDWELTIESTTDGLAPQGESQTVVDFVQSTNTLTTGAFTVAIEAGDTYKLYKIINTVIFTANADTELGTFGCGDVLTLYKGIPHTVKIQIRTANALGTASLLNMCTTAFEVSDYQYQQGPDANTNLETYQDNTTLTFIPAADDYLVIATWEFAGTNVGRGTVGQLLYDAEVWGEVARDPTVINDYSLYSVIRKQTLTAASHTWKIQYMSEAGGGTSTTYIRRPRIVVIRLSDLGTIDNYTTNSQTADSGTTTTLVDAALTEADDYWNGWLLTITAAGGGPPEGESQFVTDFVASTDTLTTATFTTAIDTGDSYTLTSDAYIEVEAESSSALTTYINFIQLMFNHETYENCYRIIWGLISGQQSATKLYYGALYYNGVQLGESIHNPNEVTDYTPMWSGFHRYYDPWQQTIEGQYKAAAGQTTYAKNARILAIRADTLNPFTDAAHTTLSDFDTNPEDTVYLQGCFYYRGDAVTVAYYDNDGTQLATDSVTVGPTGVLNSQLHFPTYYGSAVPGTWHAVVYEDITSSPNGTVDSGSTTTLVDAAALTEQEDYWNGWTLNIITTTDTFAPQGESQVVTDFNATTDTLTTGAFTAAIGAGDTYNLTNNPRMTYTTANDPRSIKEVAFTVTGTAIPEFPTTLAAITVSGICFGIYWVLKRKRLAYIKA
ncbi:hypothetical protein ACFLVM_02200 [Chloroflexota bacterium]